MEVVGYAEIKKDAKSCMGVTNPDDFIGKICRVFEFADDCVMVLNPDGNAIASFDITDVHRSFKCSVVGEHICPPDISTREQYEYVMKCNMRKGGYDKTLSKMVVASSLVHGEFNDKFLW